MNDRIEALMAEVVAEVRRAEAKHRPIASPHEGYAVILEELDELWEHVRADTGRTPAARKEAIQIAAMGLRYALNVAPAAEPDMDRLWLIPGASEAIELREALEAADTPFWRPIRLVNAMTGAQSWFVRVPFGDAETGDLEGWEAERFDSAGAAHAYVREMTAAASGAVA